MACAADTAGLTAVLACARADPVGTPAREQGTVFSIVACWRNLGAFAVYGLGWFVVVLALGLLDRFLLSQLPVPMLGNILAISAGLWVASAFYASLYFTVVDCFESSADTGTPPLDAEPHTDA